MHTIFRKALHSLQQAGGAYCIVAAHKDHDARASLRGFQEGDNLRVLRPKEEKVTGVETPDAHLSFFRKIFWLCTKNDMGCAKVKLRAI